MSIVCRRGHGYVAPEEGGVPPSPLVQYLFEDATSGDGDTVADTSGNSNNSIIIGSGATHISRDSGQAIALDGASAIDANSIEPLWAVDAASVSVSMIVKTSTAAGKLWYRGALHGEMQIGIWGGNLYAAANISGTWKLAGVSANAITDGAWHQVGLIYQRGVRIGLWIDGNEVADVAPAAASLQTGSTQSRIGCYHNGSVNSDFFTGVIDNVYMEERAFTLQEMESLASEAVA